MAIGKWIGGFLGFMAAGPLGAIAGIVLGNLFDAVLDAVNAPGTNGTRTFDTGDNWQRRYETQQRDEEGMRNSFRFSLLVLMSYIINADGRAMHSEMDVARQFLRTNFGASAEKEGNEILTKLIKHQKDVGANAFRASVMQSCQQIKMHTDYSTRLQLLSFLAAIAQADSVVAPEEINALYEVAYQLGLSKAEVDSMLNLRTGKTDLEAAYKVLEISPSATDEEVKAAYRAMALKHHPDRVATLGDDVRKAAEKKFQEINAAKDVIYKARGL
ncbi:MAG: TerB family tellurite resistance protein [Prevotella sp.]|nr:TerB family tellurite resistance protein [Prevotella sp.]